MKKPIKPTLFVLEGGECTGKSTIARRLADELSCQMEKRVRTPNRSLLLDIVIDDIKRQAQRTSVGNGAGGHVVFDRWQMVSDIIYEKYCHGEDSVLESIYPILINSCEAAGVMVIYLDVSEAEMVRRFEDRGDFLRTLDEAKITRKAYKKFFSPGELGERLPHIEIDVTNLTKEEAYQKVLTFINKF